jgi:hypothetical protein
LTDEELDEKERRGDEAAAGCLTSGTGCCLIELLFSAIALAGLMFLPFQLFR